MAQEIKIYLSDEAVVEIEATRGMGTQAWESFVEGESQRLLSLQSWLLRSRDLSRWSTAWGSGKSIDFERPKFAFCLLS